MSKQPRVGIALATYNPNLGFLRLQLESLARQTYANWFVVIHDDQSMDLAILENLVRDILPAGKFLVARGSSRLGAVGNFASSLELIPEDCELIAFCDQDDEWEWEKLERLVRKFSDGVMAVHSDLALIDGEGRSLGRTTWEIEKRDIGRPSFEKLIFRNSVTGCSMMFRRELINEALPIPVQPLRAPNFFHDVWIALFALDRGEVIALNEPLVRYRQHGGNVVGAERSRGGLSLKSARAKCLNAFRSRYELEKSWRERGAHRPSLFTRGFDLGLPILIRTLLWTVFCSRGYLRIGLQLTLGKLFWDLRIRHESGNI